MSEYTDDAGRFDYDEPNDDFEICEECGQPYLTNRPHKHRPAEPEV